MRSSNAEKIMRIFRIIWWCLVVAPLAIVTAYNVFRQEINPNLPPLISILPAWHWAIWLSVAFFTIILALVYEIYRKVPSTSENTSSVSSRAETGGQAYSAGRDVVVNPFPETRLPNIIMGFSDENNQLTQKVTLSLRPILEPPDFEKLIEVKRNELLQNYKAEPPKFKVRDNPLRKDELYSQVMRSLEGARASYKERVEKYLEAYRDYQLLVYDLSVLDERLRQLQPVMENRSQSPATSVIIEMFFPEDFPFATHRITGLLNMRAFHKAVSNTEYRPSKPKDPELDKLPGSDQIIPFEGAIRDGVRLREAGTPPPNKIDFKGVEFTKQRSKIVLRYRKDELIQNYPITDLPHILVWLKDIKTSTKWVIPIKVFSKELPEPTTGSVQIEVIVPS